MVDSIETYRCCRLGCTDRFSTQTFRIQQLEKLRENYQSNSERIRDNYTMQVEAAVQCSVQCTVQYNVQYNVQYSVQYSTVYIAV